mmetsp:Transcript_21571/g.47215  ORF Transcript_21571/g.47215 Transcript_21571/m.47215 type:complete len:209 (+) Transcript_21571:591-1217(+)
MQVQVEGAGQVGEAGLGGGPTRCCCCCGHRRILRRLACRHGLLLLLQGRGRGGPCGSCLGPRRCSRPRLHAWGLAARVCRQGDGHRVGSPWRRPPLHDGHGLDVEGTYTPHERLLHVLLQLGPRLSLTCQLLVHVLKLIPEVVDLPRVLPCYLPPSLLQVPLVLVHQRDPALLQGCLEPAPEGAPLEVCLVVPALRTLHAHLGTARYD